MEKREEGVFNCMKKSLIKRKEKKNTVMEPIEFWFLHPVIPLPFTEIENVHTVQEAESGTLIF